MSYKLTPNNVDFHPVLPLPQHLDHKPVYATPYQSFDGIYAYGETDIRYVSVGIAQYDHDHVSIKAMRHTGEKWTRMAEELPLHRPVDMTIFLAKVLFDSQNGSIEVPVGTFANQSVKIIIEQEEARTRGEIDRYHRFLATHAELYKERFNALFAVLRNLKDSGKF